MPFTLHPPKQHATVDLPGFGKFAIMTGHYQSNGALAVMLTQFGEPYTTLSVNMDHGQNAESKDLPPRCFYLKDWSENGPIAEAIVRTGWFKPRPDVPTSFSGHVWADAWELLDKPDVAYDISGEAIGFPPTGGAL